jgi:hypothetical protein
VPLQACNGTALPYFSGCCLNDLICVLLLLLLVVVVVVVVVNDNNTCEEITHRLMEGNRSCYAYKGLMTSTLSNVTIILKERSN